MTIGREMGSARRFEVLGATHKGGRALILLVLAAFSGCSRQKEIHLVVDVQKDPDRPALIEVNGNPRGYETGARKELIVRSHEGDVLTVAVTVDSIQYQKLLVTGQNTYSLYFRFMSPVRSETSAFVHDTSGPAGPAPMHPIGTPGIAQLRVTDILRFPATSLTGRRDAALEIVNSGTQALKVRGIAVEGTCPHDFTIEGPSKFDVHPGQQVTLQVHFVPHSGGIRTAVLSILSNDDAKKHFQIALSGVGQADTVDEAVTATLQEAVRELDGQQFSQSERTCSALLKRNPYDADAFYLRARSRFELRLYDAAIGDFGLFYAYRTNTRDPANLDRHTCEALYFKAMAGSRRYQNMPAGDESENARKEASGFWKDFLGLDMCTFDHHLIENATQELRKLEGAL